MISWLRPLTQTTPIGLDIGRTGLRAVQLARRGSTYSVDRCALADYFDQAAEQGSNADELLERLRRCIRDGGFRGRLVVTGCGSPAIAFHAVELPRAVLAGSPTDLGQIMRVELSRLLADDETDLETRHWSLPATGVAAPNVIAVTARRSAVLDRFRQVESAGLTCTIIDPQALALSRFASLLSPPSSDGIRGILDLGYEATNLVVTVDHCPVLVRRVGSGGCAWSERIAQALQVSARTAEIHKREHGIAFSRRGERSRPNETADAEIAGILHGALRAELRDLASEVKRSYEYVLSCYPQRRAADLILTGGGAATRKLPESLANVLAIPVRRASDYLGEPGCRLQLVSLERNRLELFATAIGLVVEV